MTKFLVLFLDRRLFLRPASGKRAPYMWAPCKADDVLRVAGHLIFLVVMLLTAPAVTFAEDMRGVLVYGHEERTIGLCGDHRLYWVVAAADVRDQIVAGVARETDRPYQPVMLVFDGQFVERPLPGLAGDVDGMIEVRAIRSLSAAGVAACKRAASKIRFDLKRLNADGLQGPPNGLKALDYEYCIPDNPHAIAQVRKIDPTAQIFRQSPGRIGCGESEVLCLGNTHQAGYREVLGRLAGLCFVREIREAFFE